MRLEGFRKMTLSWRQRPIFANRLLSIGIGVFWCGSLFALLPDEQNNVDIYERCNPATVNITTTTLRLDFFTYLYPQEGVASGFFIRPDGFIITNDHVLGNAAKVEVTLFDKAQYNATVVGRDPYSDLAVVKIDAKGKRFVPLPMGDPSKLKVGQKVFAIGNPFKLGGTLTVGIISSLDRELRSDGGTTGRGRKIKNVIQTDAAINPGNSGGPLLDSSGNLIGINTQIFSPNGGSVGVGFAISVKTVKKITEQLIQFGSILRPFLGLEGVGMGERILEALEVGTSHGVMVTSILPGSPAAQAKLRKHNQVVLYHLQEIPKGGDVIYQIDDKKIDEMLDIDDYIFEKEVGDQVTIHYYRGKSKRSVSVKLEPTNKKIRAY